MTLGILVDNISPNLSVVPDKFLSRNTRPRVLRARFGDGYEQRLPDGINTLETTYEITFINRPKAEIDDIVAYLDLKAGATAFNFTIPDSNASPEETTIKVVCEDYNLIYVSSNCYTCTATFRRVYEI